MQEAALEYNREALNFPRTLVDGGFDMVIFLTGVGTRALTRLAETVYSREQWVAALRQVTIVARGPKPVAALAELGVPASLAAPEPNTWREVLRALDERSDSFPLRGRRIAVQEYGASNPELLAGLAERGASVTRVPIYEWALPDDTGPLRAAVREVVRGEVDVALFTTSVQIIHLLRIAREMDSEEALLRSFARIVVGSIGPMTQRSCGSMACPSISNLSIRGWGSWSTKRQAAAANCWTGSARAKAPSERDLETTEASRASAIRRKLSSKD